MSLGEIGPNAPSFGSTLRAGIAGRCPACHHGKLYSGYLAVAPKCNVCGLDYAFAVLLPLVLLRSFKGLLIALQFRHKAEEGKLASE